jgi:acyl-CoA reductase-like NAD-dependent aldehyde dehydrogenase
MMPGVRNVVLLTDEAASVRAAKARVAKVSVTGSTAVGRRIAQACGNPGRAHLRGTA